MTAGQGDGASLPRKAIPPLAPAPDPPAEDLSPDDLIPDPDDVVLQWAERLDQLDYLELLRLPSPRRTPSDEVGAPGADDVRRAFRTFSLAFHPDRHLGAEAEVRAAATRVFARGVEGYRVLLDPLLGKRYLRKLHAGSLRMPPEEIAQLAGRKDHGVRAGDVVRSPGARAFAELADELMDRGELRKARLQLQLASARDPDNVRLQTILEELEDRLRTSKPPR